MNTLTLTRTLIEHPSLTPHRKASLGSGIPFMNNLTFLAFVLMMFGVLGMQATARATARARARARTRSGTRARARARARARVRVRDKMASKP